MKKLILLLSLFITNISTACDGVEIRNKNVRFTGTPENPITDTEFKEAINSIPNKENIKNLYINGVVTVPPNVLCNLPNLLIIKINGLPFNKITLRPGAFNNLSKIERLEIINTNFLKDVLNIELPILKELTIINCNLTAIPDLNNFPNLTDVVFINNPLTNLAALCQPHQNIRSFVLGKKDLSKYSFVLPDGAFNNWVNLLNVELGAAVTRLEGIAFEGVPKFEGIPEEEPLKTNIMNLYPLKHDRPTYFPNISLNVHICECPDNLLLQIINLGLPCKNICEFRDEKCDH